MGFLGHLGLANPKLESLLARNGRSFHKYGRLPATFEEFRAANDADKITVTMRSISHRANDARRQLYLMKQALVKLEVDMHESINDALLHAHLQSGRFRELSKTGANKTITGTELIAALKKDPEFGTELGAKANPYRLKAQIEKTEALLATYNKILDRAGELKQAGHFKLSDRARVAMQKSYNRMLWWIRDHPIAGGMTAAALIIMVKLTLAIVGLLAIDTAAKKVETRIKERHRKKLEQTAKQQRALPPPRAQQQIAVPQAAVPGMTPQQAYAYPTPFMPSPVAQLTGPTPLQTALTGLAS